MAIQHIDDRGNLTWACPHRGEADASCGQTHTHHISHESIQWHGMEGTHEKHHMVSLPPCSACGARTFLKVHFTEAELKAPNMWIPWTSEYESDYQRLKQAVEHPEQDLDMLKEQLANLETIRRAGGQHTNSHAMAQRHIELARQLKASGKHPKTGEQSDAESE